jgi:hypothetical protein
VRGLLPGAYRIKVEKPGSNAYSSRLVHVVNQNLQAVDIVVGVEHSLSGRVVLESPPAGLEQQKTAMDIVLRAGFQDDETARVKPDLSFEAQGLSAVSYRVILEDTPEGAYFKTMRLGGRDLPAPDIEVPDQGSISQLEVVLAFDSATLSGTVKPARPASVFLFPQENQSPYLVERSTDTDPSGNFSLTAIAPGSYAVFAVPRSMAVEVADPDVRRRLESYSKSLRLDRNAKATIELVTAPDSDLP